MDRWGPSKECGCGRVLSDGQPCPDCDEEEIHWQLNLLDDQKQEEDYVSSS